MAGSRSSGSAQGSSASRPRVLVIDDEPRVCAAITGQLRKAGFDAEPGMDGLEGLTLARRTPFDAIVLDDRLSGLSGREILRDLRVSGHRTSVLFLTGYPTEQAEREVLAYVATIYCRKPMRGPALAATLRKLLANTEPPAAALSSAAGRSDTKDPAQEQHGLRRVAVRSKVDRETNMLAPDVLDLGGAPKESDPVATLLDFVASTRRPDDRRPQLATRQRRALLHHLGLLIATAGTFILFSAGCKAFKVINSRRSEIVAARDLDDIRHLIERAAESDWSRIHGGLARVIEVGNQVEVATKRAFAQALRLSERDAEVLLARELDLDLPTLRLLLRVRPIIVALARSGDHVAQIGYAHGYEHKSQVDHDLRRLLGVTPKEFRLLCRDLG